MKNKYLFGILCIIVLLLSFCNSQKGTGFNNLLPVPQQVSLSDQHYLLDNSWFIDFTANIPENDPAVLSLTSELKDRFNLKIKSKNKNNGIPNDKIFTAETRRTQRKII